MIGILMYTLYDQTTGKNTPKNVGMYTSGDHFQSTLTIPNLTAGHTYYLMVTRQVTNSVRIQCQTGTGKSCACSFS